MSRLEELIAEHCPDGVEYKKLGEVFDMNIGYTPSRKNKSYWTDGTIPWFTLKDIRENGNILSDSIEHVHESGVRGNLIPANSLVLSNSATVGVHALIETDFICSRRFTRFTDNGKYDVDMKFMYYYFEIVGGLALDNTHTSSFPSISSRWLRNLTIPLPPIEVQNEIARILDTFTELTQELTQERELREKQYDYYRDTLLTFDDDVEVKKLGDVCEVKAGQNINKKFISENIGEYPVLNSGKEPLGYVDTYNVENDEIGVASRGTVGYVSWTEGKYFRGNLNYGVTVKDSSKLNNRYLYYYMKNNEYAIDALCTFHGIPALNKSRLETLEIPIPPIEVQNEIVEKLDRFNTLANDIDHGLPKEIELRTKQYEYYRDKLLTFNEVTA